MQGSGVDVGVIVVGPEEDGFGAGFSVGVGFSVGLAVVGNDRNI